VLINDRALSSTIDVQTNQGVVTLSGKVKSKDEESKAIELARTVRGVTDVRSKLEIQP
jgi:osmotically-inducible protein OsmY